MTVIAWDGKNLSADTLCLGKNNSVMHMTKIAKIVKADVQYLIGVAGSAGNIELYRRWIEIDDMKTTMPDTFSKKDNDILILIAKNKNIKNPTVCVYSENKRPYLLLNRPFALGAGDDAARALMLSGRTSSEAVKIIIETNMLCGGEVTTLSFD